MEKSQSIIFALIFITIFFILQYFEQKNSQIVSTLTSTIQVTANQEKELFSTLKDELNRRELHKYIVEIFYTLYDFSISNSSSTNEYDVDKLQLLTLWAESANLTDFELHKKTLGGVTLKIQSVLKNLQNPPDCSAASIIICDVKEVEFETKLSQYSYCLQLAAKTERTFLMLENESHSNTGASSWTNFFAPASSCSYAKHVDVKEIVDVSLAENQDARVIKVNMIKYSHQARKPLTIPSQFSTILFQHHSNPPAFFAAQFTCYLWKLNEQLQKKIEKNNAKIQVNKGFIVGIYVSKTQKTLKDHTDLVEEHMKWAENWFRVKEIQLNKLLRRRIFIATDDSALIKLARKKYPNYEIYEDEQLVKMNELKTEDAKSLLEKSISDIHLLSKCDYIVCTTKSKECHMAYNLMQLSKSVVDDHWISLDVIDQYRLGTQDHEILASDSDSYALTARINLEVNNTKGSISNFHNDSNKETNERTNQTAYYSPSSMTKDKYHIVDFPIFNENIM